MVTDNSVDKCLICEQEFRVSKMTDGKCDFCNTRFPNIKSKTDLKRERQNDNFNKDNFENRVKRQILDVLDELGMLSECECGEKFYKRSPAQKSCGKCKKETE